MIKFLTEQMKTDGENSALTLSYDGSHCRTVNATSIFFKLIESGSKLWEP